MRAFDQLRNNVVENHLLSPFWQVSLLLLVVACASPSSADDFFDGPAATPGDPIFYSIYSVLPSQKGNANMQKVADGGFTAAGPYYGTERDPTIDSTGFYARVNQAAAHGLNYIGHMPDHPDVINDTSGFIRGNSMAAIPEADLRQHVRDVMDFTLNDSTANATVSAWYTNPEELRPWRSQEMNYLHIVVDEIKSHDPLGRPVSMYNPTHRSSSQLDTITGQGLDETLMGVYVTPVPFATRGARVANGADRILTSANSTSTKPVMGVQLSEDFNAADLSGLQAALGGATPAAAIKQVIRHDVYQGLMRGIEGVQIWSGCDCRTGLTTYSEQLDGYISVSEDLNLGLNLSDVFLQGESRSDFQATVLTGPTTVTHDSTTIDTITLSDIAYGDDRYLFLANSSNSPLTISVDGLPAGIPQINDLFTNAPELSVTTATGQMLLDMAPLEVIGLQIQDISNADANGDGDIDGVDFLTWQRGLGTSGATTVANGDYNYDGLVDGFDLSVWGNQYGTGTAVLAASAVVPEPSTALLLLCAAAIGLVRHRNQEWSSTTQPTSKYLSIR